MAAELSIIVGSTQSILVQLRRADGKPEDLRAPDADKATFAIREVVGAPTTLATWSTDAANLVIDKPNGTLTLTVTGAVADALPSGVYVGQAAVRFGNVDSWKYSGRITVIISKPVGFKI